MMAEFNIAKDLNHPNIIKYMYLLKNYNHDKEKYESHMIMEEGKGVNLDDYIK